MTIEDERQRLQDFASELSEAERNWMLAVSAAERMGWQVHLVGPRGAREVRVYPPACTETEHQVSDDYEISVRVLADIHWKKPPANFTEEMQRQQARIKIAAMGRDLDETAKELLKRNLPTGD